jgi:hypothetical protein
VHYKQKTEIDKWTLCTHQGNRELVSLHLT